jgi:hypothetical protein
MNNNTKYCLGWCIAAPFLLALYVAIVWFWAWLFMLLWNYVCHDTFHWTNAITHIQAFWLWLLISFIGGAFRACISKSD